MSFQNVFKVFHYDGVGSFKRIILLTKEFLRICRDTSGLDIRSKEAGIKVKKSTIDLYL